MKSLRTRQLPLLMLVAAGLAAGCGQKQSASGPETSSSLPVEAITVEAQPLALSSELPGRIEPFRVAEVRARVAGIVLSRNFTEGADVKAGQVLFQIDPAPFKAALSRAQGELARAEAALADAQAVVRRYGPLVAVEAVSQQDFDAAQATFKSAQAARQSALAEVETARLNLGYATVVAPISGRIGRAQVTEGALVGQGETTALATIQQIDRVYADFKQPVADVLRLRDALAAGRLTQEPDKGAPISVTIDGTGQRREGRLLFSDITVDRNTGQISLRGQFDNPDGLLLPGMYVRVHVGQSTDPKAILVPQRAIKRGTDGKSQVLAVGRDDRIEVRPVVTGATHGTAWHVLEGLAPGDRVVVDGQANPGDKVSIVARATSKDGKPEAEPAAGAARD
ncbi:efflux RND transporter periplasmic adaptor subunit [Thauera sinica]|uniref:Efflux RND transporter periplasmic adaptor subunit n=1 Tax=Thauera sinica TaxID=2665146 RepID=A0ABW1ANF2_9RHOO|nr:efflux RND transporter periplasmic adaptor subunit [Thauera sp. K11]ATE62784.1 efflux transporter periplasmic adaptor subunit [Thauera sp. K11]